MAQFSRGRQISNTRVLELLLPVADPGSTSIKLAPKVVLTKYEYDAANHC
jgi:hypothetical protein